MRPTGKTVQVLIKSGVIQSLGLGRLWRSDRCLMLKKGNIVSSDWNSALKTCLVSLFCCVWQGLDQWWNTVFGRKTHTLVEDIEWIVYINPTFWSFFSFFWFFHWQQKDLLPIFSSYKNTLRTLQRKRGSHVSLHRILHWSVALVYTKGEHCHGFCWSHRFGPNAGVGGWRIRTEQVQWVIVTWEISKLILTMTVAHIYCKISLSLSFFFL